MFFRDWLLLQQQENKILLLFILSQLVPLLNLCLNRKKCTRIHALKRNFLGKMMLIWTVSVVLLSFYFCFKGKRIRILCTDVIITTFMYHLFISAQHHPHCSLIGFATLRIPFSFLFFSKCKLVAKFM